jgi:hypothetical protein
MHCHTVSSADTSRQSSTTSHSLTALQISTTVPLQRVASTAVHGVGRTVCWPGHAISTSRVAMALARRMGVPVFWQSNDHDAFVADLVKRHREGLVGGHFDADLAHVSLRRGESTGDPVEVDNLDYSHWTKTMNIKRKG